MQTGFDPEKLHSMLSELGWQLVEDLFPAEIEKRYFRDSNDGYHARPHVHFATAVL